MAEKKKRKASASSRRRSKAPIQWIDRLDWSPLPEATAIKIMAPAVGATDAAQLAPWDIRGRVAPLPFYKHWRLVVLSSAYREDGKPIPMEDVYALWREGREPLRLDGDSMPVHMVNADESLQLTSEQIPDYIRFFCFAVRGEDNEPFILWEEAPESSHDDHGVAHIAQPLTAKGWDEELNLLFETTVIFSGHAFHAVFAVPPNGGIQMVDDDPLPVTLPAKRVPRPPDLGLGSLLSSQLSQLLASAPAAVAPKPASGRAASGRRARVAKQPKNTAPAMVQMVELLLERALLAQSQNRLLGYFNATLPSAKPLDQFAALMLSAAPVVVVETNMPFVEETIGEIVNDRIRGSGQLMVYTAGIPGDNAPISFSLPSGGPALVLMPLQVHRSVAQVERVAFDIATGDLAAIIACDRVGHLPESLRQIKDVVLHLPALDATTFAKLFRGVMGHSLPVDWESAGTDWIKHLLPSDFEHPRRMNLPREQALAYIRSQVTERLSDVDPQRERGLDQLAGLGEARQFAEDLIADIHAAMNGTLPWSQVDRGALLVGPPGTGKTTLAKAIAKDCGIRFISASAAGWQAAGDSLGPHISAIRRSFAEARNYAPSILFIDEIDSLGNREEFTGQNVIYQTEVVNAVLEEMSGLDPTAPVFYIGATNHEDRVDPALRRSGRLDRTILIPRPNSAALDQIYAWYIAELGSGIPVDRRLDTVALGRLSVGLTGADVERIVRGAARRARKANRPMSQTDVIDEVTNKPRGTESYVTLTPADLERTATHEAGHALALFLSRSKGSDIGFVTVVPREDGTLGFVAPLPDDRVHMTLGDYEDKLDSFLAGRAAEELKYGAEQISSGAGSDLQSATALVSQMVTQLGLGGRGRLLWSAAMTAEDMAVAETILMQSYERVLERLRAHKKVLATLADALVARQELTGDEARAILRKASRTGSGSRSRGASAGRLKVRRRSSSSSSPRSDK